LNVYVLFEDVIMRNAKEIKKLVNIN